MTIYLLQTDEALPHGKACSTIAEAIAEAARSIQGGHVIRLQYEDGRDVEATHSDIHEAAALLGSVEPKPDLGEPCIKATDAARELSQSLPHI